MAISYKILGQYSTVFANTSNTLYVVPASNSAVISTLAVCNRANSATYRVNIIPSSLNRETPDANTFIVYDNYIEQYDSVFLTLGITLAANDAVVVLAGTANTPANLSYTVFGSEIY